MEVVLRPAVELALRDLRALLPKRTASFTGRPDELRWLAEAGRGPAAVTQVLTGLGGFVPSIALGNDLSTSPCTANDVEIIGPGIVINDKHRSTIGPRHSLASAWSMPISIAPNLAFPKNCYSDILLSFSGAPCLPRFRIQLNP